MRINITVTDEDNDNYTFTASFSSDPNCGEETIQLIDHFLKVANSYEEAQYYQDSELDEASLEEGYHAQESANRWQWTVDQMTKNVTLKDVDPNANQR